MPSVILAYSGGLLVSKGNAVSLFLTYGPVPSHSTERECISHRHLLLRDSNSHILGAGEARKGCQFQSSQLPATVDAGLRAMGSSALDKD